MVYYLKFRWQRNGYLMKWGERREPTISCSSAISVKYSLTWQVYNGVVLYKECFVNLSLLLEMMGISDYFQFGLS